VSGAGGRVVQPSTAGRYFADLHTHSRASFDSLASPASLVRTAAARGLTHLAITDHDRIDGAIEGREQAAAIAPGLMVIVGEEIRTADGDLVCLFVDRAIQPGLSAEETIAEARAQGAIVGIPHPFDRFRGSLLRGAGMERVAPLVDWVEGHNARVAGGRANEQAGEFARAHDIGQIAVSDAHSTFEVGVAYTAFAQDPSTAAGLVAGLADAELIRGRASFYVRLLTPVAKLVQQARGNGRIPPPGKRPTAAPR
jgi:predicted metal-dependent phosphoesterase TrpH